MKALRGFSKPVALALTGLILLGNPKITEARSVSRDIRVQLEVIAPVELHIPDEGKINENREGPVLTEEELANENITKTEYRDKTGGIVILYTKVAEF